MQTLVALSLVSGSLACIGGLLGGGGGGCCPSAAPSCGNPCGPRPPVGYAAPPITPPSGLGNAYPVAPSGPISPPIAVPPPPPPPPPPPAAPVQAPYIPSPLPPAPVQPIPFFGQTVGGGQPQGAGGAYPLPQGFQHMVGASLGGNFGAAPVFGQQNAGGFGGQPSAVSSYAQTPSAGGFQAVSNYAQQTLPAQPTIQQPVQQFVQQAPAVPDNYYAQRPVEQTYGNQGGVGNTGVGTAVEESAGGEYRAVVKNGPSVDQQVSGGGSVNYDDIVDTPHDQGSFVAPAQPAPTVNVQPAETSQPFAPVDPVVPARPYTQPQEVPQPVAPARPYTQPQEIAQPVAPVPATTYTNTRIVAEPVAPQVPSVPFIQPQTVVTQVIKTVEPVPQTHFVQPSVPQVVPHVPSHTVVQPAPVQPQVQPVRPQPQPEVPSVEQVGSQEETTENEHSQTSIDSKPQVGQTGASNEENDQHYDDSDALDQELPQPVETAQKTAVAQPIPGQQHTQVHSVQVPQVVPQVAVSQSKTPIQPYHPQPVPQHVSTGNNVIPSAQVPQQHISTSSRVQVAPSPQRPSVTTIHKVITTQESHAAIDEIDGLLNPSTKDQATNVVEKQVHSGGLDFKQVAKEINTTPNPRSTIPSATRFSTTAPAVTEPAHVESLSNEEHYDDDEEVPETPSVHQVLPAQEPNKVEVAPAGKVLVDAAPEQQPRVTVPIPVEVPATAARITTTTDISIINIGQGSDYDEAPAPTHEDRAEVPVPAESFSGGATNAPAPESCAAGDPNCDVACKPGQHCGQEETEQEIVEPQQQNGFDYGDEAPTDDQKPIIVNSENEAKATGGNSNYVESRAKGIRQLETKPLKASGDLSLVEQYEARFRMAKRARRA